MIKVLNTINFSKSLHYNPFAYIRSEKDILKLVTTIIAEHEGRRRKIFGRFLGECDSFADGKKSAHEQRFSVVRRLVV